MHLTNTMRLRLTWHIPISNQRKCKSSVIFTVRNQGKFLHIAILTCRVRCEMHQRLRALYVRVLFCVLRSGGSGAQIPWCGRDSLGRPPPALRCCMRGHPARTRRLLGQQRLRVQQRQRR